MVIKGKGSHRRSRRRLKRDQDKKGTIDIKRSLQGFQPGRIGGSSSSGNMTLNEDD